VCVLCVCVCVHAFARVRVLVSHAQGCVRSIQAPHGPHHEGGVDEVGMEGGALSDGAGQDRGRGGCERPIPKPEGIVRGFLLRLVLQHPVTSPNEACGAPRTGCPCQYYGVMQAEGGSQAKARTPCLSTYPFFPFPVPFTIEAAPQPPRHTHPLRCQSSQTQTRSR